MSRSKRQEEIVQKWKNSSYSGILVAATGFGKTRVALLGIESFKDEIKVLVVVPTIVLKQQWESLNFQYKSCHNCCYN